MLLDPGQYCALLLSFGCSTRMVVSEWRELDGLIWVKANSFSCMVLYTCRKMLIKSPI
jgi:hypothetical protein